MSHRYELITPRTLWLLLQFFIKAIINSKFHTIQRIIFRGDKSKKLLVKVFA
jgi:hypothetical protein